MFIFLIFLLYQYNKKNTKNEKMDDDDKILEITDEPQKKVTGKKRKRKVSEKLPTISPPSSSSSFVEVSPKKEKKTSKRGRPKKTDVVEIITEKTTNNNNNNDQDVKKMTTLIYNIKYNRKSIKTKYLINHVNEDDYGRILQSIFKNEFYKYQFDTQIINTSRKNVAFFGIKHPRLKKKNRKNNNSSRNSIFYEKTIRPPSSYEKTINGNPILFVVDTDSYGATMEMNRYLNDLRLKKSPKMKLIENNIGEDYIEI